MGVVLPRALAVLRSDCEDGARVVGEEEPAVPDDGRELDEALCPERPEPPERRPQPDVAAEALALGVEAVRGPRDARLLRGWRRGLGRDELDRRGSFDVARLVLDVQVPRRSTADDPEHDDRPREQEPLQLHRRTTA